MDIHSTIRLANGVTIPRLGLGTYLLKGKTLTRALTTAIDCGYRLIDTATLYGNEREIGETLRHSGIPREEFFITTKLWNSDHGFNSTLQAFQRSLDLLQTDYIDLYLIHWPVPRLRVDTWRALEDLYETKKCRAIGVSNYYIPHLQEIFEQGHHVPMVDQVEFHPFLNLEPLIAYAETQHIVIESYAPLTHVYKLHDSRLSSLTAKYEKTAAQILLRWGIQKNVVVIPKSAHPDRIRQNADIFDFHIDPEDMVKLNQLHEEFHSDWDPSDVE